MITTAKSERRPGPAPWRLAMWGAIALLLLLPLVAMQFTREVAWSAADFAAAAVLLVGGGTIFEVAARYVADAKLRVVIGALVVVAVALVWLEGAVGIFG